MKPKTASYGDDGDNMTMKKKKKKPMPKHPSVKKGGKKR